MLTDLVGEDKTNNRLTKMRARKQQTKQVCILMGLLMLVGGGVMYSDTIANKKVAQVLQRVADLQEQVAGEGPPTSPLAPPSTFTTAAVPRPKTAPTVTHLKEDMELETISPSATSSHSTPIPPSPFLPTPVEAGILKAKASAAMTSSHSTPTPPSPFLPTPVEAGILKAKASAAMKSAAQQPKLGSPKVTPEQSSLPKSVTTGTEPLSQFARKPDTLARNKKATIGVIFPFVGAVGTTRGKLTQASWLTLCRAIRAAPAVTVHILALDDREPLPKDGVAFKDGVPNTRKDMGKAPEWFAKGATACGPNVGGFSRQQVSRKRSHTTSTALLAPQTSHKTP